MIETVYLEFLGIPEGLFCGVLFVHEDNPFLPLLWHNLGTIRIVWNCSEKAVTRAYKAYKVFLTWIINQSVIRTAFSTCLRGICIIWRMNVHFLYPCRWSESDGKTSSPGKFFNNGFELLHLETFSPFRTCPGCIHLWWVCIVFIHATGTEGGWKRFKPRKVFQRLLWIISPKVWNSSVNNRDVFWNIPLWAKVIIRETTPKAVSWRSSFKRFVELIIKVSLMT